MKRRGLVILLAAQVVGCGGGGDGGTGDGGVCKDTCTEGAKMCEGATYKVCTRLPSGCLGWSLPQTCADGMVCSGGECVSSCSDQCTAGNVRCAQGGLQTCMLRPTGCTDWGAAVPCPSGQVCSGGKCVNSCTDQCTEGAKQCSGSGVATCKKMASGCTDWDAPVPCPTGQICSGGQCVKNCTDQCTAGAKQCSGNGVSRCKVMPSGCTDWDTPKPCPTGQICSGGACVASCTDQCTAGATQCSGSGVSTCKMMASGCTDWDTPVPCPSGQYCSGGKCVGSCTDQCTAGATQCSGSGVSTCKTMASGCTDWDTPVPCPSGQFCSGGKCVTSCTNQCTAGATQCSGNGVSTCKTMASGCTDWDTSVPCPTGQVCSGGACVASCTNQCAAGAKQCSGTGVSTCKTMASGCTDWDTPVPCPSGQYCSGGKCVASCTNQCTAGAKKCSGNGVSTCSTMASGCTDWDTAVPCPSGQTCSGGVCQSGGGCTHKCLPGQTSCSGQSVLACTFDGSCYVWGTGTPCPTGQTCVAGVCKEGSVTFAQSATLCGEHHYTGDVIVQGGAKVSCSGDLTITAKTIFIDPASSIVVSGSYKKLRLRATDAVTIYGAATGGSYGEVQVTAPKIEVSSSGKITASSGTVQLLHGDDLSNQGTISAKTKQISWMPPLEITSSTHPDPERWFNDTFQSVQISWTKPYPEAKGYWYLLDDKSTTQVTPFNGTFTSGHAVTYPSSTITKPGAWYFHIVTVHKNDDAGTVGNQFSFRINAKAHTVASSTHPSQSTWYSDPSKKTVTFTWSAPSGVPAGSFKGIWYRMDNAKNTETPASAGLAGWTFTTNKQVLLQKDHLGALFKDWAYYFHVVSEDTLGNLGKAVATYLVQIGAEPPKMNFFGYVTDASSAAKLSGVTVFLEPYGLSATTDTNGYFIFNSAYEGPYALTAEKTGYKTVGLQVDIKSGVVPYSFALSK